MGRDDRTGQYEEDIERLLRFITEEGGAGGTLGPDGLRLGIPNWEERTKHQRFAERAKTHGYPLGFAKSQYRVRDRLVEEMRGRVEGLGGEERAAFALAHEAIAWALDAERFLGSFNQGARGGFPVDSVDRVADHLLAWLDHRGYQVVRKATKADHEAQHDVR